MANKNEKFSQNVAGLFYVDKQCIACDACVQEAPLFFTMNDIQGHAYVKRQPQTERDIENCLNAMKYCPVEAIGNDGTD